ncbi:MAG TPA: biotin--[acetyl-CoA-carboxylase] ligase [Rhodospirillaceae bacterium]|nr:biotin--[acetyl-CoA-carboxylase] ligase [Rhodospirillaceae bacterium]
MTIVWRIETFDTLPSTQETVKDRAAKGEAEGFVVQALEQTGGKGRHGREWVSPKGNLYLSILLRPDYEARRIGEFSFIAALALFETVLEHVQDQSLVMLKWPNDVLLGGKKCAGILLESGLQPDGKVDWLVVGIGLNVTSAPPIGSALTDYAQNLLDIALIRDKLLAHIDTYISLWQDKGFNEIRRLWMSRAHKPGAPLQIKLGETLKQGYFHAIDEGGNLLLRLENGGIETITAGDVYAIGD